MPQAKRHGIATADTPPGHRWTNDRIQAEAMPNTVFQTCTCGLRRKVTNYPQRPFQIQRRPTMR